MGLKNNHIKQSFSYMLMNEYSSLLEQMEYMECQETSILQLGTKILTSDISDEEKNIHLNFLSRIQIINEELQNHYWMSEHLKVLNELGQTLMKTFDHEQIYQKTYELVSRVMDSDAFFIALYNEEDHTIHIPFMIDSGVRYEPIQLNYGEGFVSKVIETRKTIHVRTEQEANSYNYVRWGSPDNDTSTALFVPLLLGDHIKGAISVQSYREFAYKKRHEELLQLVGGQVVSAIESVRLYNRVYELSIKDDLTGLKNRRAFHLDLDAMIENAKQRNGRVTLIMLDSDNLKQVNDRCGHHAGDLLINQIAQTLQRLVDPDEGVYRYAGDEFIILSTRMSHQSAVERAVKIQEVLREQRFECLGEQFRITVSIGIAHYPDDCGDSIELQRAADEALYRSKENGKNQISIFSRRKT